MALGPGDVIFAGVQVHRVEIRFEQPAWWDSLVHNYSEGRERYMAADVTIDGVDIDSVGVRFKGNASYHHPNDKKPFRLRFDAFDPGGNWDRLTGVHLNNCWEDPTFIREKLHLDLCRDAGIPAPRANYAELYLNGELWGLYSLVEHVDKTFLSSRYDNNDGNLYKAMDGFLGTPISDFKWYGSDPSSYRGKYELKTDDSPRPWTDLVAIIDSLNNTPDPAVSLPPVVEMRDLYRAISADVLLANLDSYSGSGRNFYFYIDEVTGRMRWIVWDAGMSFGSYRFAAQNYETLSVTYVRSPTSRPLVGRLHGAPDLLEGYLQALCALSSRFLNPDRIFPRIDEIADRVRPYVQADPRKMYTDVQFEENIESDITVSGHRKPGLKAFIEARSLNVQAQLADLGIQCPGPGVGDVVINEVAASNTRILDPAGEADDWLELYNNSDADFDLSGMHLSDRRLQPTKWQFPAGTSIDAGSYLIVWMDANLDQDGLHASFRLSASGEEILLADTQGAILDSLTFGPQTPDRTLARVPNGTGPFTECYPSFNRSNDRISINIGDIVINEFMANNSVITDPAGDTDDWIELANLTGDAIDLGGVFVSDDPTELLKWEFPSGTTIPARGYLVMWADEDIDQEGLHASFKLSAQGECIVLSSIDGTVIDSLCYVGQQPEDSAARFPDGTGPFLPDSSPTPGAANDGDATAARALRQSTPNPFRTTTTLSFSIVQSGDVTLRVFDLRGRLVRTVLQQPMTPGFYRMDFDAEALASGIYVCQLKTPGGVSTRKLLLLK